MGGNGKRGGPWSRHSRTALSLSLPLKEGRKASTSQTKRTIKSINRPIQVEGGAVWCGVPGAS